MKQEHARPVHREQESTLRYFSKSRRRFLKISGVALAGIALSGLKREDAKAVSMTAGAAIAQALQDAGVRVATNVPATGVTALFDAFNALSDISPAYSFNEEVAYTVAHGAALAGVRSAALVKSHGLAKAANSVVDSLTLGTTAGFVVIVPDDPSGKHSDTIFDAEAFLRGTGIPFKKSAPDTLYNDVLECIAWSEELGVPVALFFDGERAHETTLVARRRLDEVNVKYVRDPLRHVLCPPLAPYQRQVLEARLARKDWRSLTPPELPPIPDGLPSHWREPAKCFQPVFEVLQELRPQIPVVCGDAGLATLFAFPPFSCVDACSYYGGSLPLAIGFHQGGIEHPWAITGDYAFLAGGHMGLIEALALDVPLKVLIMNNGCAMATGCQPIPKGVYEQALSGWESYVSYIEDPNDAVAVRDVLQSVIASKRLEIVSIQFQS